MKNIRACKNCHLLSEKDVCPVCSLPTAKRWSGYLVVREPESSQIAKEMKITKPGKYALKVR